MKLMGLTNWVYWLSWYANALAMAAVTIAVIVALVCIAWVPEMGGVSETHCYFQSPAVC